MLIGSTSVAQIGTGLVLKLPNGVSLLGTGVGLSETYEPDTAPVTGAIKTVSFRPFLVPVTDRVLYLGDCEYDVFMITSKEDSLY